MLKNYYCKILKVFSINSQLLRILISMMFVLFFVAFFKSLQTLTWDHVRLGLLTLSLTQISQSIAATFISYLLLGIIEYLNLKNLKAPVRFRDAFYISWTANAITNHFSFAGLSGVAVRLKHFEERGIEPKKALYLTVFNSTSLWVGYGLTLLITFLFSTLPKLKLNYNIPTFFSPLLLIVVGISLLTFLVLYSGYISRKVESRLKVKLPELKEMAPQFILATLDWFISGFALYSLMPQTFDISFGGFMSVFLSAQFLGIVLSVPGGIGVLESLILAISFSGQPTELIGSLIFFRLIYYILPLGFCLMSFGVSQLRKSSPLFYKSIQSLGRSFNDKSATLFTLIFAVQGYLLTDAKIFSSDPLQMLLVTSLAPAELTKISQSLLGFSGFLLMIIAVGLFLRSNLAWGLALMVSAGTVLISLFSGIPFENSAYLFLSAAVLLFYKKEFQQRAWIFSNFCSYRCAGLMITAAACLLGIYYDGARALRSPSSIGFGSHLTSIFFQTSFISSHIFFICTALSGLILLSFMIPQFSNKVISSGSDVLPETVDKIITGSPYTVSQMAYLGDKKFFLNEDKSGFIMYRVHGRSWISMGDPIGQKPQETIKQFAKAAVLAGGLPLFYQVRRNQIADYYDLGFKVKKIGEEAIINLKDFNLDGPERHGLRNTYKRVKKAGVEFKILTPGQFLQRQDEFRKVSEDWLKKSSGKEKGFSLGNFNVKYLARYFHAVLVKEGQIIAFANIWRTDNRTELSVDLMRYSGEAPSGCMDYLFLNLIRYGQENGYRTFNLGMSPLAGLAQNTSPFWNIVGAFLFENTDRFYNFQGVRNFKNKYHPIWECRYVAYHSSLSAALGLVNVVHIIANPVDSSEAA